MNWRIQFVFFINVSWLTSVCKWDTLICLPCSPVILYIFPLIKKDTSYVTSPSAHINTQGIWGCVQVETHTRARAGKDAPIHNPTRQQCNMCMPSKRHWVQPNGCPQKSHRQHFLFWHQPVSVRSVTQPSHTEDTQQYKCSGTAFRRSRLRCVSLTGCIKGSATLSLCLSVSAMDMKPVQTPIRRHCGSMLVQYLCVVTLTCITLSFPGMYSHAASLKLLAPVIPLKPQRLPLAFSHDSSVVVFKVCGLIFSKAPHAPPKHYAHSCTRAQTDFTRFF